MATAAIAAIVWAAFVNGGFAAAAEPQVPVERSSDRTGDVGATAVAYAAEFGVSPAEANRRLDLQITVDSQVQEMKDLAPSRFAGAWIEHVPEFRAVIAFTGTGDLDTLQSSAADSGLPVVVRTGARFSLDELSDGLGRLRLRLDSDFPDVGSDIDVKDGSIRLIGPRPLSAEALDVLETIAEVPIVVDVAPAPFNAHTYGGRKLTASGALECTTGFTVKHIPSGDRGVLTAGHCVENLVYHQGEGTTYPLTYKGEFQDGSHDGQWMQGTHTTYDDFWDGDSLNDNGGEVSRANSLGDFVCHMGYGSNQPLGRSCGTVVSITFAPPFPICGPENAPVPCNNVWIRVEGPNLACWGGDSGGPLFSGSWFYGISKACSSVGPAPGQTSWAAFMSRDFLVDMNLAVLYLSN